MGRFSVGDVVRLKSGGWPMTVTATNGPKVKCMWFDRSYTNAVDGPAWSGPTEYEFEANALEETEVH